MAFQSLYRRYRPQRFDEVIGQAHLVNALRNAIVEDRVGHAYLFSGPRGTGKTSTARVLAKALNCVDLSDTGEPCGECHSCVSVQNGTSMDLVELDAASNNGVDNIRELIAKASLGSPGRRKVYLLDEVHMFSTAASNALLKTLEEPPGHVVFVLATTDPQKVLPTIRSRTQHVELSLVGAAELAQHVRNVGEWAGADVTDEITDYVVTRGGGSVRDTLSALDQVLAAGGIPNNRVSVDQLVDSIAAGDLGAALGAVATAVEAGVDSRDLAERTTRRLRDCFLVLANVPPGALPAAELDRLHELGMALGRAMCVRALELLGTALVDMRQAPDPRLTLEVAVVRLLQAESSTDLASLAQRVERLERGAPPLVAPGPPAEVPATATSASPPPLSSAAEAAPPAPSPSSPPASPPAPRPTGPNAARAALDELRGQPETVQTAAESTAPHAGSPAVPPPPPPMPTGSVPPPPPSPVPSSPAPVPPVLVPPAPTAAPVPPVAEPEPEPEPEVAPPPAFDGTDEAPYDDSASFGAFEPPPAPFEDQEYTAEAPPVVAEAPVEARRPELAVAEPAIPTLATPEPAAAELIAPEPAPPVVELSHGRIVEVWADRVLPKLGGMTRAMYAAVEFVGVEGDEAIFETPNDKHRERCETRIGDVEIALSEELGRPVKIRLVDGQSDGGQGSEVSSAPGSTPPADETVDLTQLEDVPPDGRSNLDRITDAFPGATIVDDPGGMI
jgi:DNA polymerase-3 subunit gamma/tau